MGLLMDSKGIPLAFNTFPRNESEKTNILPTIRRVKRNLDINRIIVVADRGLNTSDNTALLSGKNHDEMEQNDGYVYGQSILMSDKKFKEWVLDQSDYKYDEEIDEHGNKIIFKHKSRVYAKKVTFLEQNYYLFDYRDRVTDDFSRKYGWNLSQKYMSQATIKNILKHRKKE